MTAREQFDAKAQTVGKAIAQLMMRLKREKAEKKAAPKARKP